METSRSIDERLPVSPRDQSSFGEILAVHRRLDDLFASHQEALLLREIERAGELLDAFERALVSHMRFEEEALFPVYERAGPIPGGGVGLYLAEHAKLLRFLGRIEEGLRTLAPGEPGAPRRIVAVLDYEARFKNLMAHHDLRERNILYPTLDRVATDRERHELLDAAGRLRFALCERAAAAGGGALDT